jgi:hypothetical protein
MWQTELLKKYKALKLEIESGYNSPSQENIFLAMLGAKSLPSKSNQKYLIILPRLPDDTTLAELKKGIPEGTVYEIIENLKPSTTNRVKYLLQSGQCMSADSKTTGRHLDLNVAVMPGKDIEEYGTVWADINEAFLEDGFLDTWNINCGDMKLYCDRKIMEERRKNAGIRDISILAEDVMNLKIALGATQDVNEFLAMLEGK